MQVGTIGHEDAPGSIELFAVKVMPKLAGRRGDRARWRAHQLRDLDHLVETSI
jgi:hypothetical protein